MHERACLQDYFRDITQEDILTLMPVALDPEEDDSLTVPFLGRDPRINEIPGPLKGKHTGRDDRDDDAEVRLCLLALHIRSLATMECPVLRVYAHPNPTCGVGRLMSNR